MSNHAIHAMRWELVSRCNLPYDGSCPQACFDPCFKFDGGGESRRTSTPRSEEKAFVLGGEYVFGITNMRFHGSMTEILGSPTRVDLLRVLARAHGSPLSGRELARQVSASASQVNLHLRTLQSHGLVKASTVGRVHLWSLSFDHALSKPLQELFEAEPLLFKQLQEQLETTLRSLPIERAIMFGSVARGDESPESDIDLFIETRGSEEKERVADALSAASIRFAQRFGNPLSNLILTRAEVERSSNPALFAAIKREGISLRI